jgi:hypothetical protein
MKIWCMCIAWWIPKATDTHSEYVILIAFPLQQWLQECASMLCYTYTACLVLYRFCGKWMREYFSSLFHTICWFFVVVEVIFGGWNVWGRRLMFVFNLSWVKVYYIRIFLYIFLKSIIVYRHTGCGTCQDSRYNIVIHEYYILHIDKNTYYVSR